MKTAREVAHELVGFRCSRDGKYHTAACDDGTAAIEARDREVVEACATVADDAMYPLLPGEVGKGWAGALGHVSLAIRSLAPLPGGTK